MPKKGILEERKYKEFFYNFSKDYFYKGIFLKFSKDYL